MLLQSMKLCQDLFGGPVPAFINVIVNVNSHLKIKNSWRVPVLSIVKQKSLGLGDS